MAGTTGVDADADTDNTAEMAGDDALPAAAPAEAGTKPANPAKPAAELAVRAGVDGAAAGAATDSADDDEDAAAAWPAPLVEAVKPTAGWRGKPALRPRGLPNARPGDNTPAGCASVAGKPATTAASGQPIVFPRPASWEPPSRKCLFARQKRAAIQSASGKCPGDAAAAALADGRWAPREGDANGAPALPAATGEPKKPPLACEPLEGAVDAFSPPVYPSAFPPPLRGETNSPAALLRRISGVPPIEGRCCDILTPGMPQ